MHAAWCMLLYVHRRKKNDIYKMHILYIHKYIYIYKFGDYKFCKQYTYYAKKYD